MVRVLDYESKEYMFKISRGLHVLLSLSFFRDLKISASNPSGPGGF